eukprot:scaffold56914_cov63-Phaeocystis_antarctica.AAC.4
MEEFWEEVEGVAKQLDQAIIRPVARLAQVIHELGEHLRLVLNELEPLVDRHAQRPHEVDRHEYLELLALFPRCPSAQRVVPRMREEELEDGHLEHVVVDHKGAHLSAAQALLEGATVVAQGTRQWRNEAGQGEDDVDCSDALVLVLVAHHFVLQGDEGELGLGARRLVVVRVAVVKLNVQPAAPVPRDHAALAVLLMLDPAADQKEVVVVLIDRLALARILLLLLGGVAHVHCQRAAPLVLHVVHHTGERKEGLVLVPHRDLDRMGPVEQAAHQLAARVLPPARVYGGIGEIPRRKCGERARALVLCGVVGHNYLGDIEQQRVDRRVEAPRRRPQLFRTGGRAVLDEQRFVARGGGTADQSDHHHLRVDQS